MENQICYQRALLQNYHRCVTVGLHQVSLILLLVMVGSGIQSYLDHSIIAMVLFVGSWLHLRTLGQITDLLTATKNLSEFVLSDDRFNEAMRFYVLRKQIIELEVYVPSLKPVAKWLTDRRYNPENLKSLPKLLSIWVKISNLVKTSFK